MDEKEMKERLEASYEWNKTQAEHNTKLELAVQELTTKVEELENKIAPKDQPQDQQEMSEDDYLRHMITKNHNRKNRVRKNIKI